MFESDLDKNERKMQRRTFLALSASAVGGIVLGSLRTAGMVAASVENVPGEATIVEFSDDGKKLRKVRVPKVVKTEAEWKKLLSPNAFDITRHADTEMAFTGKYWNLHEKGLYRCICCDNALFDSDTKFESGTGWPSFTQPVSADAVVNIEDRSYGMRRVEVRCARCDGHLGHVFPDGPPPTGLRYCMNSAALLHVPAGETLPLVTKG